MTCDISNHLSFDRESYQPEFYTQILPDFARRLVAVALAAPEQIVSAALQEDADVIGLSILSGAHMHICPRVVGLLREQGLDDVLEALERRTKQFRSREELWPVRVPREPLVLDAGVRNGREEGALHARLLGDRETG